MEERPVIVRESGDNGGVAMIGILAIVVIVAAVLFAWQPWNAPASGNKTTIINQQPAQQPAANAGGNAAGGAGSSGTSGSSSGSSGSSSGGSSSNGQ